MRFLNPGAWWWLSVMPVVVGAWWVHRRARLRFTRRFGVALPGAWTEVLLLLSGTIAVASFTAALAHPQLQREHEQPQFATIDAVFLIDRSASMLAADVKPSRFARATSELRRLLLDRSELFGRVGLIEFSSSAVTLSPFTRDLGAVSFYLDWMREDSSVRFGTDLKTALTQALDLISRDRQTTRKIVVVVSDGASQDTDIDDSLATLARLQVPVYAAAIGVDATAPILVRTASAAPSALVDDDGSMLRANTDPAILEQMARATGGRFLSAPDGAGLSEQLAGALAHRRSIVGTQRTVEYRDMYQAFLLTGAAAAALLVMVL